MTARRHRIEPGPAYCRPEKKRIRAARTSPKWCECGRKVHGPNHEDGDHHGHTVPKCRRGGW